MPYIPTIEELETLKHAHDTACRLEARVWELALRLRDEYDQSTGVVVRAARGYLNQKLLTSEAVDTSLDYRFARMCALQARNPELTHWCLVNS